MVAIAGDAGVTDNLVTLEQATSGLEPSDFAALAQASSRIGASRVGRRLPSSLIQADGGVGARARLLLCHFVAGLDALDPLDVLTLEQLVEVSGHGAASWPVVRAVTARIVRGDTAVPELLEALRACGSDAVITVPSTPPATVTLITEEVLANPSDFPLGWVIVAERWHSSANAESPLATLALERKWVPDL